MTQWMRARVFYTRALRLSLYSLVGVCVTAAVPAHAATIYVDARLSASCAPGQYSVATRTCGGNSGSGYNTFASAMSAMQPGDTIDIRGGTYRTPLNITRSGTSGGRLRFIGHAGETVTIDLSGWSGSPSDGVSMIGRQYIDIAGLIVLNAPGYGLVTKSASANITISDVEIGYSRHGGVIFEGGSNITVTRAKVHHSNNGGNWQEAVTFQGVDGFSITDSEVYENNKEGIDAKYGARNGVIARNQSYRNNGPNIYIDAATDIKVYSNVCRDTRSAGKACIGLSIESIYNPSHVPTRNISIYNNAIWGSGAGIWFWVEAEESWARFDNIRIEYNTVVDNSQNPWGGVFFLNGTTQNFGTGNTIRNNIFMGNSWGIHGNSGVLAAFTIANNLFQSGESSTTNGVSGIFANASTSTFVNRAGRDFRLTSSSPARMAGQPIAGITTDITGAARPTSATDVGAYQYGTGGGSTPPPTTPPPTTPAASCALSASPGSIVSGSGTTLSWTTSNATALSINQGIGTLASVASGSLTRTLSATTTFTATAVGPGGTGTCNATVTVTTSTTPPPSGGTVSVWNSWDVAVQGGSPQATVTASATGIRTNVELYESANDDGVAKGGLFGAFNGSAHPQTFNATEQYWAAASGSTYPYAGKSTVNRGAGAGEANTPSPSGVRDLQLHPPDNRHYVVAAFRVPFDGTYTISNLGVRRVHNQGGNVRYHVLNTQGVEIATLQATANQAWVVSGGSYTLSNLVAGTSLYFAVDRGDSDFYYDATEITWTVTASAGSPPPPPVSQWHAWDVTTQAGSTQGVVAAAGTGVNAQLEFYESTDAFGVARGALFSSFSPGTHPDGFNNLQQYWGAGTGATYPYAGKSTIARGSGGGESNAAAPLGVRDLQLHPPNNTNMVVAAFKVPSAGSYTISNLGARRVHGDGADVVYRVFNAQRVEIARLTATNNQTWVLNSQTYSLSNLAAGSYLYFAVDRGADFYYYDATEITWTVTRTGP